MTTKAQVLASLAKTTPAGQWREGYDDDAYFFEAWLPDEYIWNNGYQSGVVYQQKEEHETWSDFWTNAIVAISGGVVLDPHATAGAKADTP